MFTTPKNKIISYPLLRVKIKKGYNVSMKNLKALLALLLVFSFVFSAVACGGGDESSDDVTDAIAESNEASTDDTTSTVPSDVTVRDPNYKSLNYDTMKGIWISQYDTAVFCSGGKQRDINNFKSRVDKICKAISQSGFNTVVLQVRPFGDSFFPSEVYPASSFVVGAYGREFKYDPFKIFIEKAHEYKLSVHAWINPMRLMTTSEIEKISTDYRIGEWYQNEELRNKYMSVFDNRYYLVPGFEETRQLVADGVTEICKNYNVDAVHIDDYFYPTAATTFDASHYQSVKDDYASLASYRLEKVNQLVNGIYKAVKAVDESILFGISPAGSISNNMSSLFADVRSWGSRTGFCDYLAPQVYWGFEHPNAKQKFDLCTEDWAKICTEPSVKLVIGMGIYRANGAKENGEFAEYYASKDVIKRQLEYLEANEDVDGFIMYSFQDLFDDYGRSTNALKLERENFLPVLQAYGE